jgi:hypothetical protein
MENGGNLSTKYLFSPNKGDAMTYSIRTQTSHAQIDSFNT